MPPEGPRPPLHHYLRDAAPPAPADGAVDADVHGQVTLDSRALRARASSPSGYLVIRQTFRQPVRLTELDAGPPLAFVDCVFRKGLSARDATLGRSLMFVDCTLGALDDPGADDIALDLENARLGGELSFYNCRLGGRLFAPALKTTSHVRLRGCMIAPRIQDIGEAVRVDQLGSAAPDVGGVLLDRLLDRLGWKPLATEWPSAVCFDGAEVGGDLEIAFASGEARRTSHAGEALLAAGPTDTSASVLLGSLSGRGLHVRGRVSIFGALCRGGGVNLSFSRCDGTMAFFCPEARSVAASHLRAEFITLEGATIGGDLDVRCAEIERDVTLYKARIVGNLSLLGLHTGRHLVLVYSHIEGDATAFRDAHNPAPGRRSLSIGGGLYLSGADVRAIYFRGIDVTGTIVVITGRFGRLVLSLGIEPDDRGHFWPQPCRAAAVTLSAIKVEETVDLAGLQIRPADDREPREGSRSGLTLTGCEIGRDLTFFIATAQSRLEGRWGGRVQWGGSPSPGDCESRIRGGLDLRGNVIGGHLDLRNVKVETVIQLNDTKVGLDVRLGSDDEVFTVADSGLSTCCGYMNAEKLQCDGDLDLRGLRVRRAGGWGDADPAALGGTAGSISARGARVKGEILLMPRDKALPSPQEPAVKDTVAKERGTSPLPGHTWIEGRLDLTAAEADHLVLSRSNFECDGVPAAPAGPSLSLERGRFGRLEIVKPPPESIDLSRITVNRWEFGDKAEPNAADYIAVLRKMEPFDRSTWIGVETALRNQMAENDANEVYRAMRGAARSRTPASWRRRAVALLIPVTSILVLAAAAMLDIVHVTWLQALVMLVLGVSAAWAVVDKDGMYGTILGFGTRAWWPMIPAAALFFVTWVVVFSQPENVRASTAFLEAFDAAELMPNGSRTPELSLTRIEPGSWTWHDSLALTLRYQVPIIPSVTHGWWEASGRRLPGLGITAEQYALWLTVYHWIAWPLFLIWLAARVVRGRQT